MKHPKRHQGTKRVISYYLGNGIGGVVQHLDHYSVLGPLQLTCRCYRQLVHLHTPSPSRAQKTQHTKINI
jgi:hypothetical protein